MNQKQLEELESEMYPPGRFDKNCNEYTGEYGCCLPDENGLLFHAYTGDTPSGKSYSAPMFEIKKDVCAATCRRCRADYAWNFQRDDQVTIIDWYPYFNKWGNKDVRRIFFDPDFAAESPHP